MKKQREPCRRGFMERLHPLYLCWFAAIKFIKCISCDL